MSSPTTTTSIGTTSNSAPSSASTASATAAVAPPAGLPFMQLLEERVKAIDSLLCIGLDPHPQDLKAYAATIVENTSRSASTNSHPTDNPSQIALAFCQHLIQATVPYAACYKPNAAFFEALGEAGHIALKKLIADIHQRHKVPVLLDVKRGDIGSTATAYAQAAYGSLKADAVTLSPLMGWDSVAPFVTDAFSNKGAFVLCKTSNPGSNDLLTLPIVTSDNNNNNNNNNNSNNNNNNNNNNEQVLLYEQIAKLVGREWNAKLSSDFGETSNALGLVVGATDSVALEKARKAAGENVWILAPGVGAQGGDLVAACKAGCNAQGTGLLIPVSRGISRAANPAKAAEEFRDAIRQAVQQVKAANTAAAAAAETPESTTSSPVLSLQAYQKEFIEFSLQEGVLKFGSFVLKSGRTSPYFFNAGLFCTGKSLHQLARAYASAVMDSPKLTTFDQRTKKQQVTFDVIFGPAYKGISLGAVVSSALYAQYGVSVGFAYNRKEAKDHGEGGVLVGADMAGKRILVVDDVITAGTAIRESYDLLKAIDPGTSVVGVAIALDRAEKRSLDDPVSAVQAVARDLNIPVVSIVNLPQLQTFLKSSDNYGPDVLQSVSDYRAEYGVSDD